MAKICGFVSTTNNEAAIADTVRTMARAMQHDGLDQVAYHRSTGAGIALLRRPDDEPDNALCSDKQRGTLALAGYALHTPRTQQTGGTGSGEMRACDMLRGCESDRDAFLSQSNGDWAFAAYDPHRATLTLASSTYGFCPLYYYADARGCWFASEVKALVEVISQVQLDWGAAADFFYIGHMIGTRTLFTEVAALDAGEVLTYTGGRVTRRQYADFTRTPVMPANEVSVDKLASQFLEAVERRLDVERTNTLLLSGGLDSRLILGALHRLGARPRLVSLEHANIRQGADGRYAAQIAQHLGLECEVRPTRKNFYDSPDAINVFYMLDGVVPTWDLFIGQIYPELSPDLDTVWDGLALDVGLGGSHQCSTDPQANMTEFLEKRAQHRRLLRHILTPEAFNVLDGQFVDRLRAAIEEIPATENRYTYFLLKHRTRRRIAPNPHQLYASRVAARTPGTDLAFMEQVLAIPSSIKLNHAVYLELVRSHFPELLQVPLVSGGSLVHANQSSTTAVRDAVERLRMTFIRSARELGINKRMKHMLGKPLTLRDQELYRLIGRVLADSRFDRPFYHTAQLQRMWVEYRRGNILHHELFTLVFYIELWHQLFLERGSTKLFERAANVQTELSALMH